MKNLIMLFLLISLSACHSTAKKSSAERAATFPKQGKKVIKAEHYTLKNTSDGKIFNQCDLNCIWQYYYPFLDSTYVVAIQNCPEEYFGVTDNAILYFGRNKAENDQVFLKDSLFIKIKSEFVEYNDFNGDDIKDIMIFSETGGRGGNAFYYLYLIDPKSKRIIRIKDFETIVNPEYNKKHNVIIGYGLSGTNNYSIYKISKNNSVYPIGESFEDDFDSVDEELDKRITQILKEN